MSVVSGLALGKERLLRELLERVADHLAADRAEVVCAFARMYARRLPAEVAAGLTAEELFGQVMGVFELADARGTDPIAVRAFNPTLAGDGYTSVGTIVEQNTEDSPFLVDSLTEEISKQGHSIRFVLHPIIGVQRDDEGRIASVSEAIEAETRESVMHFELERHLKPDELERLTEGLRRVLGDVRRAVRDFREMQARIGRMVEGAREGTTRYGQDEIDETVSFLEWLLADNYVFLGYREYELVGEGDARALRVVPQSGLGILAEEESSAYAEGVRLSTIDPKLRVRIEGGDLLIVSKTNRASSIHRRAKMDYIGVKTVGPDGAITGERRMLGLFTSKAYGEHAGQIPLLRRKLQHVLTAEDLVPGSHDYKAAVTLLGSFPLDELLAAPPEALQSTVLDLLELQEQHKVRLFARRDLLERSVSLLVALPRDRFNAELRHRLQDLFMERFHGTSVDYHLALGEADPAQIHFRIHVGDGQIPDVSFSDLEQEVIALARTWEDRLTERLVALHGEERGRELASRWSERLPEHYKSATGIYLAVLDVEHLERLEAGESFVVSVQNERGHAERLTRVHLYKAGERANLSDLMPLLEALGLDVVEELPVRVEAAEREFHLHNFGVVGPGGAPIDVSEAGERVAETITAIWNGETESDSLDRLVVLAGLTWRQVAVLRAFRTYLQRVSAGFTGEYQNDAFAANPRIAADLVEYFELRLDPSVEPDPSGELELRTKILAELEAVPSLDQDRILRSYLELIDAIVRTNVFRPGRSWMSFKIRSADVPEMPKPTPLFEIFVYSTEMEGIHLRAGKVARGGIRWSDRMEDYRTEILGLMKTQTTKNAVIVPTGAKGGFVVKHPPADAAELRKEVERQYVTLVRGMLDVTDNLVDGEVVHPPDTRVLDEDDPYLVVAADKGTGTFSDTANAISEEYGFWLGDAFASGGSAGYDHKKLAITARGAWESVKRHFREVGLDVMEQPFTVVGIGDMSGDVFGNGMLYTEQIRLIAAFDHRHLFVDPDPDTAAGFAERKRLFELPRSSWDDYDHTKLSPGGGVWPRSAKHVELGAEAAAALGIEPGSYAPNDVIRAILRAPVDLLWNGGIGTYVKASTETDAEVGDRANDAVRVTGKEVRARVAGEGGNLGFTQRGRIEYAGASGRINTDFIDNSGGVDMSDHEVNLKIPLGIAIARGDLTRKQRDELLAEVADDVTRLVLNDNYLQAQILSQEEAVSESRTQDYEELMQMLEAEGLLDRGLESLPSSEEMTERARTGAPMARPELAVLLAYAKISVKTALLASTLPDDDYLEHDLAAYFPLGVVERFGALLAEHPLRRELIATIVANDVVDSQGITFVSRAIAETGAEAADVARAFRIAREVTGADTRWAEIEALDGVIDPVVQNELLAGVDWLVEMASRWYLQHAPGADIGRTIASDAPGFAELDAHLAEVIAPSSRTAREDAARQLIARGAPEELARRHVFQPALAHAADIVSVVRATGLPIADVARAFSAFGEVLHLDWLEVSLDGVPASSRWERWAINAIQDDLLLVRREAVAGALAESDGADVEEALAAFVARRPQAVGRLDRLIAQLRTEGVRHLAVLTVAVRQVRGVVG